MTQAQEQTVKIAQDLQIKREEWKGRLEQLPMPKARIRKFPYESMAEAIKDGFAQLAESEDASGADRAFRILVKGWKTIQWRKAAEHNRETRDEVAEGVLPVEKPKRVHKPKTEAAQPS
jgi:hypothetical protein